MSHDYKEIICSRFYFVLFVFLALGWLFLKFLSFKKLVLFLQSTSVQFSGQEKSMRTSVIIFGRDRLSLTLHDTFSVDL